MIRKITRNDRDLYLKLANEFYSSDAVLHTVPKEHLLRTFDEMMLRDTYAEGYILEVNGQTAGYAIISKTFSQEAGGLTVWLEELYILKEFRSKGLGSEFLEFIQKTIPAARYRLEVEADNLRAIDLYKRKGFKFLPYLQMIKETPDTH